MYLRVVTSHILLKNTLLIYDMTKLGDDLIQTEPSIYIRVHKKVNIMICQILNSIFFSLEKIEK